MRLTEGDEVVGVARIAQEKEVEEAATEDVEEKEKEEDELAPPWEANIADKEFDDDLPDELIEGEEE